MPIAETSAASQPIFDVMRSVTRALLSGFAERSELAVPHDHGLNEAQKKFRRDLEYRWAWDGQGAIGFQDRRDAEKLLVTLAERETIDSASSSMTFPSSGPMGRYARGMRKLGVGVRYSPLDLEVARARAGYDLTDHCVEVSHACAASGRIGSDELHETRHAYLTKLERDGNPTLFAGWLRPTRKTVLPLGGYFRGMSFEELSTFALEVQQAGAGLMKLRYALERGEADLEQLTPAVERLEKSLYNALRHGMHECLSESFKGLRASAEAMRDAEPKRKKKKQREGIVAFQLGPKRTLTVTPAGPNFVVEICDKRLGSRFEKTLAAKDIPDQSPDFCASLMTIVIDKLEGLTGVVDTQAETYAAIIEGVNRLKETTHVDAAAKTLRTLRTSMHALAMTHAVRRPQRIC